MFWFFWYFFWAAVNLGAVILLKWDWITPFNLVVAIFCLWQMFVAWQERWR